MQNIAIDPDALDKLTGEEEAVCFLPVTVPLADSSIELTPGEAFPLNRLPRGSWLSVIAAGQVLPAAWLDSEPSVSEQGGAAEAETIPIENLGLPKSVQKKLQDLGLADRDAVLGYAQSNGGFGEALTDAESQKVADALKATEPADE